MRFTAPFLLRTACVKRTFHGLPIVIDNPKGSVREGVDPEGRKWQREMKVDYGYIPDTVGAGDKERLDVYVGPDEDSDKAYIVEQVFEDGSFDEYKVMLGFPDLESAREAYEEHGPDQWDGLGDISEVPLDYLFDAVKEHQQEEQEQKTASLIDKFVRAYKRQRPLYVKAADVVRDEITKACGEKGIRCAVTCRAKEVESLRSKLVKRNAKRPYASFKDILHDIKDLAGVRVALYFPIDRAPVGEIIEKLYKFARKPKEFPQDREPYEPEGYEATHYAVKVGGLVVEIQVASALMYAWSEVAHDLIYKPRLGELTSEEYQLLDELKDIVSAGEHTVIALQDLLKRRTAARHPALERYVRDIILARARILVGVQGTK